MAGQAGQGRSQTMGLDLEDSEALVTAPSAAHPTLHPLGAALHGGLEVVVDTTTQDDQGRAGLIAGLFGHEP